jgi:hypothetical protein
LVEHLQPRKAGFGRTQHLLEDGIVIHLGTADDDPVGILIALLNRLFSLTLSLREDRPGQGPKHQGEKQMPTVT